MEKIKCACGHFETLEDIHGVETFNTSELTDLCEKCWQKADLIHQPNSKITSWKFISVDEQSKYLTAN